MIWTFHTSEIRRDRYVDVTHCIKHLSGEGRASPKTFYPHWLAALSCAIVYQDALTLRNCASADAFMLSHGARGSLHREM